MAGEKLEEALDWAKAVGLAGLVDMEQSPGLVAAVEQHSRAVEDALHECDRQSLDDYLNGFLEAAIERGWTSPGHYDWETLRLVAVHCMIKRAER